jgi:hypothetical protein
MDKIKYLELKYTTSKGRETYGWNIVSLIDGDKRFKTCGGGYDMIGTVLADWLQANYYDKLLPLNPLEYYGIFKTYDRKGIRLDGACGLDCIQKIAKAIGVSVQTVYKPKYGTKGFIVTESASN